MEPARFPGAFGEPSYSMELQHGAPRRPARRWHARFARTPELALSTHGRTFRTPFAIAAALLFVTAVQAKGGDEGKPIQLVAQQPPGSLSETISRIWAECASNELGQSIVVINKPGANGVIAANYLKSHPADGRTIMTVGMSQMTITPYVYRVAPYDPEKDFDGVAVLTSNALFLVASIQSRIKQLPDVTRVARAPGGVKYGSPGKGSPSHLLTAALIHSLKSEGTHVPYVGEAAGVYALLRGDIDLMTLTSGTVQPLLRTGRVTPLAVYAEARDKAFPEVPTIVELTGSATLARVGWLALVVKAGTSPSVIKRLREATARCVALDQKYREHLSNVLVTPVDSASADVTLWRNRDSAFFRPLITQLGLVE